MKPIPFDKNTKDYTFCEFSCYGYESHTGRCVGWALFGDGYPRRIGGPCLKCEDAWNVCPKNQKEEIRG